MKKTNKIINGVIFRGLAALFMAAVFIVMIPGDSFATYNNEGIAIFTKDIMPGAKYCDWGSTKFPNYCAGDAYGDCTNYNDLSPDTCGIGKDCVGDSCCGGTFYVPTVIPYGGNRWVVKSWKAFGGAFGNQSGTFPDIANPIVPDANTDLPIDCSNGPVSTPPEGTMCLAQKMFVNGCSPDHNWNGYQLLYEKWNSVTQKNEGLVDPDQMADKVSWYRTASVPPPFSATATRFLYVADSGNNRVLRLGETGNLLSMFGYAEGRFAYPRGVAVSASGEVYVVDKANNMVQKFDSQGVFVRRWGSYGNGNGQVNAPQGVAVDLSGNVYVADTGNSRIQKFDSNGNVSLIIGSAGSTDGKLNSPQGVAIDSSGNIYVADTGNNRIQVFNSSGTYVRKWGSLGGGNGQFNSPQGVAVDSSGNVYVADTVNNRIQKFDSAGTFRIAWGSSGAGDWNFSSPAGIAVDISGYIYVTDTSNKVIKKFKSDATDHHIDLIIRWGTSGSNDGQFSNPTGIAVDSDGNVYVADTGNYRIQKFQQTGKNLTVWSTSTPALNSPLGVAVDGSGNAYVADRYNHRIVKFDSNGTVVATWVKSGGGAGTNDGEFYNPHGVAISPDGYIYVADTSNHRIQKFNSSGTFLGKWGRSGGGAGSGDGEFSNPWALTFDDTGNCYVADSSNQRIQKFDPYMAFQRKWGSGGGGDGQFSNPSGVAIDAVGYVYVLDRDNNRVQKFDANGGFLSKWGTGGSSTGQFNQPYGISIDPQGTIYISEYNNRRIQIFDSGGNFVDQMPFNPAVTFNPGGVAIGASGALTVVNISGNKVYTFSEKVTFVAKWGSHGELTDFYANPRGLAVDGTGNVYVADTGNNRLQMIGASGNAVATWGSSGSSNGQFSSPSGVAIDSVGNIYVADTGNNRIQKYNRSRTFERKWGALGSGNGQFSAPSAVAVDGSGDVYVVDTNNNRIQKFKNDGTFLKTWGTLGSGDGQFLLPYGIAVDKTGVYVADTFNNRIQRFDQNGTFINKWGVAGSGVGQLILPYGVAVDGLGNVYVVDTANNRTQKFDKDGNVDDSFTPFNSLNSPAGVGIYTGNNFNSNYSCYGYRDESGTLHADQCSKVTLKALDQNTVITWIYSRIFNVAAWCKTGPGASDTCTSDEAGIIPKDATLKRETSDLIANGLTPASYTAQANTSFIRGDDRYVLTGRTVKTDSAGTMPAYLESHDTLNTFDYALHGDLEFDWHYKQQHKVRVSFSNGLPESLWTKAGAAPGYGDNWVDHGSVINPNVNFIVTDPNNGNLYQCDSWTGDGTVISNGTCTDDGSGSCAASTGYTINGMGSITWNCGRKLIINIDTSGLPDNIRDNSKIYGFYPEVSPSYGSRLNRAETFAAPNVIYDQSNGVRYKLTGWTGNGAVSATGTVNSFSSNGLTSVSVSATENTQNSKITWLYSKEVQVKVDASGLSATAPVFELRGNITTRVCAADATKACWINKDCDVAASPGPPPVAASQGTCVAVAPQPVTIAIKYCSNEPAKGCALDSDCTTGTCLIKDLSSFDTFKNTDGTLNAVGEVYGNGILPDTLITGFNKAAGTITLSKAPIYNMKGNPLTIRWLKDIPGKPRECSTASTSADCLAWVDIDSGSNWNRSGMNYYAVDKRINVTASLRFDDSGNPKVLTSNAITSVVTPVDWFEETGSNRKAGTFTAKEPFAINWIYGNTTKFTIGQAIECPSGVAGLTCGDIDYSVKPVVTIKADNPAGESVDVFFYWSAPDQRLFPVRPVGSLSIKWTKKAAAGGGYTSELYGMTTWPDYRQTHLANIPVTIQPAKNLYNFTSVKFPLVGSAVVNGIFNCETAGTRSVLLFDDPNPTVSSPYRAKFLVVETKSVSDNQTSDTSCVVGNDITDSSHQDPEGKNGYVLNVKSVYDGYGQDKAYDRETRTGNIIAVNTVTPSGVAGVADPLTIVWYDKTRKRVCSNDSVKTCSLDADCAAPGTCLAAVLVQPEIGWPIKAVNYTCSWPTIAAQSSEKIIIASGLGTGDKLLGYSEVKIYNQPDRTQPGFNPNEEHAKVINGKVYALRNDLNATDNLSEPFTLVKYKNTSGWHIRVFKVEATGDHCEGTKCQSYDLSRYITAGSPVLPISPLGLLPLMKDNNRIVPGIAPDSGGSEWHHLDHKGGHWAKAANWKGNLITSIVSKDAATTFIGSSDFGVYTSSDSGTTWTKYNDASLTDKGVRGLSNIDTALYAATKTGVFKSIIQNAWTLMPNGPADVRTVLAVSGAVYAGNPEGLWKYDTSTSVWSLKNEGLTNTDVRTIAVSPVVPANIYAGTSKGVYKSTDAGETWVAVNSDLTDTNINSISVNSARIFAATPSGVFVSANNGASWTLKEITYGPEDSPVKTKVQSVIARSTDSKVWAGTDRGAFLSTDGGDTWSEIADSLCPLDSADCLDYSVRYLAFSADNSRVYAGLNKGRIASGAIAASDWNYLSASPTEGIQSSFSMHWYYPMQSEFYMPGGITVSQNSPVPFMNGTSTSDNPTPFEYIVHWPDDNDPNLGSLRVGDTLIKAKDRCPDLSNQAAVQVIYDEGMNKDRGPLAKLMNPVSSRSVSLQYTLVDFEAISIKTQDNNGIVTFIDLPYYLRSRVLFDPNTQKLSFRGTLDDSGLGEPLLLLNVMNPQEKQKLLDFSPDAKWQTAVNALYEKTRNPYDLKYTAGTSYINPYNPANAYSAADWQTKWGMLLGLDKAVGTANKTPQPLKLLEPPMALTAGTAQGEGYVTLALNDDVSLGSAPVDLKIIKILGPPVRGEIKVINSDNLFDEKLTLRHSADFGGDPSKFVFEWYYRGDETGDAPVLPAGSLATGSGWTLMSRGPGLQSITIEGTGPMILADNWFMVRYYYGGVPVSGTTVPVYQSPVSSPPLCTGGVTPCNGESDPQDSRNWSQWAGAPSGTTAQLAEGWIKRVFGSLNLFDARVKDFHNSETNTTVSMISQIGEEYEGDIAFNSSASNLNSIGLLEAYQTVLNRGEKFSVDAGYNDGPANNALLNAASRIADFYMLLGNEAYGDAQDPTIGFTTKSGQFGTAASSIFAFQNQLSSLLEEELALLRGKDSNIGRPVYNRLVWNFTQGDGEVAYVKTYNITNQNTDGIINEYDAKIMYPQGHGDAWGYYLSAINSYYSLLNKQNFTWVPRPESVIVGGAPIKVDYMDERKFAQIAAQRAKTGTEIVDLTYRQNYVDDPAGQWQGYKDTDTVRAWGVDEWSRRAGQAAYLDWAVANSLLPEKDQNPSHTGISKIDRTTVQELRTIATEHLNIQNQADKMNKGLNPLGLAKGVVPFDIDPTLISQGKTHFEQVYERAEESMKNAITVFDYANTYTQMLRQNQDTLENFKTNIKGQEADFKNRLIEIFGYPYPEDIGSGAGKAYPEGYDGPDWIHYMYVDVPELTGNIEDTEINRYTVKFNFMASDYDKDFGISSENASKEVTFEVPRGEGWASKPSGWTKRRAPGKVQNALSEVIKAHAQFKTGRLEFQGALDALQAAVDGVNETYAFDLKKINIQDTANKATIGMDVAVSAFDLAAEYFDQTEESVEQAAEAVETAAPTSVGTAVDAGAPVRAAAETVKAVTNGAIKVGKMATMTASAALSNGISVIEKMTEARLDSLDKAKEVQDASGDIDVAFQKALEKKSSLYTLQAVIDQKLGDFKAALAEGQRIIEQRADFRQKTAGDVQSYRYEDMAFRIFKNDALQKYRAQFDLAARYVYLAATAYDYETNLLGSDSGAGRQFFTDIVKQRSLGEVIGGLPQVGRPGLADPMARLSQNFGVYKTQLGFNNPQTETNRFSIRKELFRIKADAASDDNWRGELKKYRINDLWQLPEFRKFCREFAPESSGAQPGLVIPFTSNIIFGRNFFGWPLAGGDSAYDPSHFATKVRSVGVWFSNYDAAGLSFTPRVYLIPAGEDVLRSPSGDGFAQRRWQVVDQKLPVPYPIGSSSLGNPSWIPVNDSLSDQMGGIRKISSFRAYHDGGSFNPAETTSDSRLIGRSVWNDKWMLIIPGGTLLNNQDAGLDTLINTIGDIKLFFQTYSYSGN